MVQGLRVYPRNVCCILARTSLLRKGSFKNVQIFTYNMLHLQYPVAYDFYKNFWRPFYGAYYLYVATLRSYMQDKNRVNR